MLFAVHRQSDGRVIRVGSCPDADHVTLQAQSGEVAIADAPEFVIADGLWRWTGDAFVRDDPPSPSLAEVWQEIRYQRDKRLLASDWTQLPDVPEATRAAWVVYRQALRDLTEVASPADVIWPVPPTAGEPA